jgi:membrane-associated phospholipid phosphatase
MKRAVRTLITTAVGCAALAAALPATSRAAAPEVQSPAPLTDPSLAWNEFLLGVQATPGDQPATVHPTYELAIMHAAIYDAVASIERDGAPYLASVRGPHGASAAAAADAAAHYTLVALYPNLRSSIDQQYTTLLGQLRSGRGQAEGILVGRRVAAEILQRRANDGANAAPLPFQPGTAPGDYQLTPPAFGQPVFTHWSHVTPFVLRRADEFRPPAPPALTSAKYAAAIDEVQALGAATGSTRTADQTQIGLFWNPPIWATWNRIAETAAVARRDTLFGTARTFAALNLTFADSVIAFYDAKYAYRFWRPVTAIHAADTDGNPATVADPGWSPLSPTAPDPSYPGAHGTISAAGAAVLASFYGNDTAFTVTSPALPGVARTFTSFSEAADEATVSRIYNGNHTRIDQVAGENLGRDVAGFVLARALRR